MQQDYPDHPAIYEGETVDDLYGPGYDDDYPYEDEDPLDYVDDYDYVDPFDELGLGVPAGNGIGYAY